MKTTAEVAKAFVERHSSQIVHQSTPVTTGTSHEVWQLETASETFIARFGLEDSHFDAEAELAKKWGEAAVVVPDILEIAKLEVNGQPRNVMLMRKLKGAPFSELISRLRPTELEYCLIQIGAVLQKMHSVKVGGFGLYRSGTWTHADWSSWVETRLKEHEDNLPLLCDTGLSTEELKSLLILADKLRDIPCESASLCHGDFSTEHIFFDNAFNVTGILDFELAQGGHGSLDLALFNMYHPELGLDALLEGYADRPSQTFLTQIYAQQVNTQLVFTANALRREETFILEIALPSMRATLAKWRELDA